MHATDTGSTPAHAPSSPPASLTTRLKRLSVYFGGQRLAWSLAIAATLVGAVTEPLIPALLQPLLDRPTLLLVAMMVVTILVGTAMDMTPTILILTPVFMPLVKAAGIDPVYFGVLFMINNAIGLITPPVGIVLNVLSGIARISMGAVVKGVWPFLLAQLVVLFVLVMFPQLVLVPLQWLH